MSAIRFALVLVAGEGDGKVANTRFEDLRVGAERRESFIAVLLFFLVVLNPHHGPGTRISGIGRSCRPTAQAYRYQALSVEPNRPKSSPFSSFPGVNLSGENYVTP